MLARHWTRQLTAFEVLESRVLPAVTFSVTFDDPGGAQSAYYDGLEQNLLAAGAGWAQYLDGTASIEVKIGFSASAPTANGGSATSVFLRTQDGINIFQDGAPSEIRTGVDPNGATPDINITIGIGYLTNELWLDPTPFSEADPIPFDKVDAFTVLTHELGHGLGFNGYANTTNGSLPGNYASPFDQWITFVDGNLFFNGPEAIGVYGGPVPLTFGNSTHVGNRSPRPGNDLLTDVMNGVIGFRGERVHPSILDLAILSDTELPLSVQVGVNHAPMIVPQTFSIAEHGANGTMVGKVLASDVDLHQTLSYAITSGNAAGAFSIDATTGWISIANGSLLEFDDQTTYTLAVEVIDSGTPNLTSTADITIQLTERVVPQIKTSPGTTTRGKGAAVVIDSSADVLSGPDFVDPVGTKLRAAISAGARAKDKLVISKTGDRNTRLTIKKSALKVGTVTIGTVTGGTGGTPLEITFGSNAIVEDVQRVLRKVSLQSSRKDVGTRTVTFEFILDDDQGTSTAEKNVLIP